MTETKQDAITTDTYLSSFNVEEKINLINTGSGNSIPLSFNTLTQTNNTLIDLANEK